MAPKFGTSGLRGLVTELTDSLCAAYTTAFLGGVPGDGTVLIGRDLRASSPRIARAVNAAVAALDLTPLDCGVLPTPALALAAMTRETPAIMITGSHIPDDRNGLKFYTGAGEITKDEEARITSRVTASDAPALTPIYGGPDPTPIEDYCSRYTSFFTADALANLRIGVYEHSSAARDILGHVLEQLGATVIPLARSDHFIPVDTEALSGETRIRLERWAEDHKLDAIVSTDGDADRPMVADRNGHVVLGDLLGPLTARAIGAATVATPVSSNTLVDLLGDFTVIRTRIGSPYVIAGMEAAGDARVVGYEPNGGFLTGFDARRGDRSLPALPTRDAFLPIIAPLVLAGAEGTTLDALVAALPPRFTASDRLTEVPTDRSASLINALATDTGLADRLFDGFGPRGKLDLTDGRRQHFEDGLIVHLRPSGNAPEFRVYAEADSRNRATDALERILSRLRTLLSAPP